MDRATGIRTTAFSREMRRRAQESQRAGRGFTPPGAGRPRPGGGCCLFLILIVVALVIFAYIEGYVVRQQPKNDEESRIPVIREICSVPPRVESGLPRLVFHGEFRHFGKTDSCSG